MLKFTNEKWRVIETDGSLKDRVNELLNIDLDDKQIELFYDDSYYIKLDFDIKNILFNREYVTKIKWMTFKSLIKKIDSDDIDVSLNHEARGKLHKVIETVDNTKYERKLYKEGFNLIAGIDEVGRGPLYGPVVTAAVILPKDYYIEGLTDSKKLTPRQRDKFYDIIFRDAISIGIGIEDNDEIDRVNIYEATKEAMYMAVDKLETKPDYILIDAMKLDKLTIPHRSIIKGDAKSISIAAASVIAKVTRDRMMVEEDKLHPEYGFKDHKGYPTKKHIEAVLKYGVLEKHRKSFEPIKSIINGSDLNGRK